MAINHCGKVERKELLLSIRVKLFRIILNSSNKFQKITRRTFLFPHIQISLKSRSFDVSFHQFFIPDSESRHNRVVSFWQERTSYSTHKYVILAIILTYFSSWFYAAVLEQAFRPDIYPISYFEKVTQKHRFMIHSTNMFFLQLERY